VASYRVAVNVVIYEMDGKGQMKPISSAEAPEAVQKVCAEAIWAASLTLQRFNAELTLLAAVDPENWAVVDASK